jgi:hypothetical protein
MPLTPIERMIDAACGYDPSAPLPPPAPDPRLEEAYQQIGAEVAAEVLHYIDVQYPAMWTPVAKLARTSVRRTIINAVVRALRPA